MNSKFYSIICREARDGEVAGAIVAVTVMQREAELN